jgi:hypothetical protein
MKNEGMAELCTRSRKPWPSGKGAAIRIYTTPETKGLANRTGRLGPRFG